MPTTSVAIPGTNVTVLLTPRPTVSGLWDALVASTSPRSAAGSRLAGPRLGQPISADACGDADVIDMFAYRAGVSGPESAA